MDHISLRFSGVSIRGHRSQRHPSLDCNAREKFIQNFCLRTFITYRRQKKQRREAEKLLPRDNPRQSYEYFFDPKSWNFHSWKMVFRESHSTNREKEFRAFVKIVNSMLFVQQIKLHLLERLLANCNRIIDATRGSKWVVHWNRQQPNWLCLDFYLLLNVERAKNMFPNKSFCNQWTQHSGASEHSVITYLHKASSRNPRANEKIIKIQICLILLFLLQIK